MLSSLMSWPLVRIIIILSELIRFLATWLVHVSGQLCYQVFQLVYFSANLCFLLIFFAVLSQFSYLIFKL